MNNLKENSSENIIRDTIENIEDTSIKSMYVDTLLNIYNYYLYTQINNNLNCIIKNYGSGEKYKDIFHVLNNEESYLISMFYNSNCKIDISNKSHINEEIQELKRKIKQCENCNESSSQFEDNLERLLDSSQTTSFKEFLDAYKNHYKVLTSSKIKNQILSSANNLINMYYKEDKIIFKKFYKSIASIIDEINYDDISINQIYKSLKKHDAYINYYQEYLENKSILDELINKNTNRNTFFYNHSIEIISIASKMVSLETINLLNSLSSKKETVSLIPMHLVPINELFSNKDNLVTKKNWGKVYNNQNSILNLDIVKNNIDTKTSEINFKELKSMLKIKQLFE